MLRQPVSGELDFVENGFLFLPDLANWKKNRPLKSSQ